MYFAAPMGTDEETWMERLLTFTGDVIEDQLPQAAIGPVRLFTAPSQPAKTVKPQKMLLGFQQDDNRETFTADMPGHTEEDCESIHTRPAVCVPPELASFYLSDKVAPRQALVQTHAWCTRNEKLEECKILLEWLQVACMVDGRAAIQRSQSPMVPLMDADLTARLLAKVQHDLPGWRRAPVPPPPPPTDGQPTTAVWERLMNRMLDQQRPAPPADADSTKKPSKAWKGTIAILLRLCQADNEEALPQLWHDWANCKKELRRTVLQEHFRRMARALKLPVPVATQELTNVLHTLAFAAACEGNLDQGLQPFMTAYLGEQSMADQQAINEMNDMLRDGTPSLTDIIDLKAASKLPIPAKESQTSRTLRAFTVVLAVAAGLNHPCYKKHRTEVVDKFEQVQPRLKTLVDAHPKDLVHAQLLRWLQLRFQECWTELEIALGTVEAPRFEALCEDIHCQQWRRPEIPPSYLPAVKQTKTKAGGTRSTGGGGNTDTGSKKSSEGSCVANPHKSQKLLEAGAHIGRIANFLKEALQGRSDVSVPKMDSGAQMCLAWHLKGGCCTNCQRCAASPEAHGRLNEAEAARLELFIKSGMDHISNNRASAAKQGDQE